MYNEILKFGAMIVDSLRNYKHPVFVYIPPNGELRGGAWVVIDPTINLAKMEMYADAQSRGGILEPPGICEVKYRGQDQRATMHRLDDTLIEYDELLQSSASDNDDALSSGVSKDIKNREKLLSPVYLQIAHEFADLHDRAGRMKAKGCISEVLEWKRSREFFFWRIKRRLIEDSIKDKISAISEGSFSDVQVKEKFEEVLPEMHSMASNKEIVEWLEGHSNDIETFLGALKSDYVKQKVSKLIAGLSDEDKKGLL